MQCAMCGREITNPDANYCDYCGTAVGSVTYRESQAHPQQAKEVKHDKVPMLWYLGVMCLNFIPMFGSIAYLVMLFIWAFAPSIEDSRKSWARAALIYTGITVVLFCVVFGVVFASMINGLASML